MVTSKKIAELAGVSRGTVDRALKNRGQVSEETRKKVLEIAEMLDYKPNIAGKALVSQQKHLKIGCLIIDARNPFYDDLYQGIMLKAEEYRSYGIEVLIRRVPFTVEDQCACIDQLLKEGINALLIQPINDMRLAEKLEELSLRQIPIVTTNTTLSGFRPLSYIGNDFYACGKIAANLLELITGGRSSIGIVTGFFNAQSHDDRIRGFQEYLQHQPEMVIQAIVENKDDDVESFRITAEMLQTHPDINAVFLVAGGVHGACQAIKQDPARTIKVLSFDSVPTTKDLVRDGTISATICQQPVMQGVKSMEVLFNYLFYNECPKENVLYTDIHIKMKANIDSPA